MSGFKDFYKNELYNQLGDIPENILNKYVFLECIKVTENSTTYLIEHKVIKTKNVLKIYKNAHQANEYKILSKYNHSGIPKIFDVIVEKNRTIVIEEFFQGKTFHNMMKEDGKYTEKRLIKIVLRICEILSFLHEQIPPVIHKDIKPENVIIDTNDNVKLIDFGSARVVKENQSTDTVLLGTHGYAAPEQYGFKQTDGRTDIYSLGVMIDEIATKSRLRLSEKFKKVIIKCKEIDPDNRFDNVKEIISELNEINKPIYKKKKYILSISILILTICLGIFINQYFSAVNTYSFQSDVIAEAVSIQLDKSIDKITADDLNRITELTIWGENIVDSNKNIAWESMPSNYVSAVIIDDVRYTKRGEIDTLEDLKKMHNLYSLTLVKQKITNLEPIKDLDIVHLFLNDNDIEDISALKEMTSLYTLEVGGNPIRDFGVVPHLINLGELDISDTNCSDFSFLKNMTNMRVLIAKNLKLEDIDFVSELYKLQTLNVQNNKIKNIFCVENLNQLEAFNIADNPIENISSINKMKKLKYMVIKNTLIDVDSIDNSIEIRQD